MNRRPHNLDSANRSLVLVRKVVAELQAAVGQLRQRRRELLRSRLRHPELEHIEREHEVEELRGRIRGLEAELDAIGCRVLDPDEGSVCFPVRSQQGDLELHWRAPADRIGSWAVKGGEPRPLDDLPADVVGG